LLNLRKSARIRFDPRTIPGFCTLLGEAKPACDPANINLSKVDNHVLKFNGFFSVFPSEQSERVVKRITIDKKRAVT
jgi:hypothetical protein